MTTETPYRCLTPIGIITPSYYAAWAAQRLWNAQWTVWAWFFGQPEFARLVIPADEEQELLCF